MDDSSHLDQRRHERSSFAYPVDFKILSHQMESVYYNGYIENVSVSGAGILFEDKYGKVNLNELKNSKVKMSIIMPDGEKVALISGVRWISKDPAQKFIIRIGLQFENVEDWQLVAVKKLIRLKNKDHNMMWNLWENYERQL